MNFVATAIVSAIVPWPKFQQKCGVLIGLNYILLCLKPLKSSNTTGVPQAARKIKRAKVGVNKEARSIKAAKIRENSTKTGKMRAKIGVNRLK